MCADKNGNSSKDENCVKIRNANSMSPETFQAFEKIPMVVVKPVDVTPYLPKDFNKNLKMHNGFSKHIEKLQQSCVVEVRRDNLEQLREKLFARSLTKFNIECKICGKLYDSEKKLQNHYDNKHMIFPVKPQKRVSFSDHVIVHEVNEYHSCRKCTKFFESYSLLKKHMKKKHKKRKCYICHYCSKEFMDRIIFKVHIKLHCDACGLFFPTKVKYAEHRRNICKIVKRYKCKICNETCFRFMDLKDHSYLHMGTYFVCDVCKEQCRNFCALSHHICFLHTQKHPDTMFLTSIVDGEKIYECNFCEMTFIDKSLIEKHVAELPDFYNKVMTGYKDYFFCGQCLIQFATEKEMLQHKWTHFSKIKPQNESINTEKTIFKLDEIPGHFLKPIVVLKRSKEADNLLNKLQSSRDEAMEPKQTISTVENIRKRRIIQFSKYQCQNCNKFFSSGHSLKRHINTLHRNFEDLQCKVCEEVFVWPSLLASHKCIRLHRDEMPFEDARPDIQIDNLQALDNFYIPTIDEYNVDFEIPCPIVNITEGDSTYTPPDVNTEASESVRYKLVMQEIPIEF